MSNGLAWEEADESPDYRVHVAEARRAKEWETQDEEGRKPSSEGTGEPWERWGAGQWFLEGPSGCLGERLGGLSGSQVGPGMREDRVEVAQGQEWGPYEYCSTCRLDSPRCCCMWTQAQRP